jgi:CHAT domain-containing protein/Tfp pilus assembly protein PilF
MKRGIVLFSCLFFGLLWISGNNPNQVSDYTKYYKEALKIYASENSTDADDSTALNLFAKTVSVLEKNPVNDSVLLDAYQKSGSLYIGFDDQVHANRSFNKIISFSKKKAVGDSLLFIAYLFCGRTYYSLNNFDSADICYHFAEKILDQSAIKLPDAERLYNLLGVLYYDFGNYQEALNYFKKAVQELKLSDKTGYAQNDLFFNYQINILSCFIKQNRFAEADTACDTFLLKEQQDKNFLMALNYKKAEIGIGLKKYPQALGFIKKCYYADRNQLKVLNSKALIYSELAQLDSAKSYIQKAIDANTTFYTNKNNYDLAVSYKLWGNCLASEEDFTGSLEKYQASIIKLVYLFKDSNIYANPTNFTGSFSTSQLLDCLTEKAKIFYKLYAVTNQTSDLKASLDTYQAVFALARYLEKSYSSEEAVLFLAERKFAIHNEPIRICLQLYEQTREKKYFEQALGLDEQNKNATVHKSMAERKQLQYAGVPASLLDEEINLKRNITLLTLRASGITEQKSLEENLLKITDYEIALNKLQERIRKLETRKEADIAELHLSDLQNGLAGNHGILSFHLSDTGIIGFFISKKEFLYKNIAAGDSLYHLITRFAASLNNPAPETSFANVNQLLYSKLIGPFQKNLQGLELLTIIADDELHLLPFEILENKTGQLLLEQFTLNYYTSYSNLFLQKNFSLRHQEVLAMAPFANQGISNYQQLVASVQEISGLKGKSFLDAAATKSAFLENLKNYPILHLATHARANDSFPDFSYLVFYSNRPEIDTNLLYSREIAELDLSANQLVYLSACETGAGKLVKGEGLMSLSRAFRFAGCPTIITSLWQADDHSTAYITNHFYQNLDKGYSIPRSIQMAKLEYLQDPKIEKRKKIPFYWAHLVPIGQIAPEINTNRNKLLMIFLFLAVAGILFLLRKSGKKKLL